MKRTIASDSYDDVGERPAKKLRRRDSSSTVAVPSNKEQEQITTQPLSPLSYNKINEQERGQSAIVHPSKPINKAWIPAPSEQFNEVDVMSQPASKRSRSQSTSTDRGRPRSVSPTGSGKLCDDSRDKRLLYAPFPRRSDFRSESVEIPRGLFDDEFIEDFHNTLRNRSEARLLVDLHPLLMPSAENLFIQGKDELKNVIDGYNDPWLKTEPIYGPKPQPDHARGLRWSTFSDNQRRKLGIKPGEKSLYAVREDMYFPYLTAEIKCGNQALEFADRQNMHSMCIALRAVVSLAEAAGRLGEVNRRLLGFSISHELEGVRIYGHYPEIGEDGIKYYRWLVKQFNIWADGDKWQCLRFVENLDRDFLPIHTGRLMRFLEEVPDPQELPFELESQERSSYSRAPSAQNRVLQPELRSMIQTLQQQLEEQKFQQEQLSADQKAREEKLLAQLEQQREEQKTREAEQKAREAEQKAREEKLLAQLEQQQERLFKLLEQKEK
ncbi:conserved hypothetical protein [Talaromyces stipitatus ATCC 10500]|uniref:DUF7924 domain-containing protein n=1 Tax=Talaromyces stipitatus (strain ATCC 10500 / CBS 375.48 / QM 6759 / NRRL 1006) TaxID=441959 RepID=B8MUI5_TALSN|nr:uncharacterized protein TSTA_108400 [Talaromyces stipitatus ATCC 10500]EED11653.1 conserved hypothetical protein [Talaromyces stipitatus ATCC 10500]